MKNTLLSINTNILAIISTVIRCKTICFSNYKLFGNLIGKIRRKDYKVAHEISSKVLLLFMFIANWIMKMLLHLPSSHKIILV